MASDDQYPDLDLSDYADPHVEAIYLAGATDDPLHLEMLKSELRSEADRGWCRIIFMDDEYAVVKWRDQFVIEIKDPLSLKAINADKVDEVAP